MRMKLSHFLMTLCTVLSSCAYNDSGSGEVSCTGAEVSFAVDVMPLIATTCATEASCHAAGSHEGPGALTTYAQVNAAKSDIAASVRDGTMPKNSSLTTSERNTIICWVQNGGLNN